MKRLVNIITFIILSTYGTIFGQNNWTQLPIPDTLDPFYINAELPGYLFISSGPSLFRSDDYGLTWFNISDTILLSGPIAKVNDSSLIVQGGTDLYRSDNWGNDWYPVGLPFYESPIFIKCNSNEDIFMGYWGGVLRSKNSNNYWDTIISTDNLECFCDIEFCQPYEFFIASYKYLGPPWGGFYRSLDDGQTIEHVGLIDVHIHELEKTSDDILYAGTFNNLQRSYDLGSTWEVVCDTISGVPLIISNGDSIFAGWHVNFGLPIYLSDNLGISWINYSLGVSIYTARMLSISPQGHLYIRGDLASNRKVIYSTRSPFVSINEFDFDKGTVRTFPNPCKNTLHITIPQNMLENPCEIKIFDFQGRLLLKDFNSNYIQNFSMNLGSLKTGIYFLVVISDKKIITNKIIKI